MFGNLVRHTASFSKQIDQAFLDECHFLHTAGEARHGVEAFRDPYGRLDEVKNRLSISIKWHAMTATLPNHMLATVEKKVLSQGYHLTKATSNRKNIAYGLHQIVGNLKEYRNYSCVLTSPYNPETQPRVLLFFDDTKLTAGVAAYLTSLLPPELRDSGVVVHYHSLMSASYLQRAHDAFTGASQHCRIMCATSSESVGVDFPDVDIVVTVGLPASLVDTIQRGGRCGRRFGSKALFVVFYEPWAAQISLEEFNNGNDDPDRPRITPLPVKASKQQRAPLSSVRLVQCPSCIRAFYARELNNTSPEALDFVTDFCCTNHPENPVDLSSYFPSPLLTQVRLDAMIEAAGAAEKTTKARIKYRPTAQRNGLDSKLVEWADPSKFIGVEDLTELVDESDEWHSFWGSQILAVIKEYD
ncbi:P-loop containing nucleoside triphosphate hydrolase protein, partial [Coprinopsis sp. MPI-PUGE-AT-0042]